MRNTQMEIRPISGALGAEILGVDFAAGVDDETFDRIRTTFHGHGVIVIRDQDLTPEQHVAAARRFGKINVNRFFTPVDGHPEVAEVRKEPHQKRNIGNKWHTDHSYDDEPALGSMIYALEVPPVGGDTMFANMSLAWETLSDGMKDMLSKLEAVHSSRHVFGPGYKANPDVADRFQNAEQAVQDAVHPVVIRHPETGRKVLYVNPTFTVRFNGWTEEESRRLLDYLYEHASRPEFSCRVQWREGSLGLWDNRATWHLALNDYPGHRRLMHRVTIEGTALSA
ncbi:MAG: TauD/TfdA family dioxygenase [Thiotrichales bacterium]|nr:TauD/TfdA family dioxygenase [Thiotrichales bacterium]